MHTSTYGLQGVFWLWMNYELEWKGVKGNKPKLKRRGKWEWGWKKVVLTVVNVGCFVVGTVIVSRSSSNAEDSVPALMLAVLMTSFSSSWQGSTRAPSTFTRMLGMLASRLAAPLDEEFVGVHATPAGSEESKAGISSEVGNSAEPTNATLRKLPLPMTSPEIRKSR
jgi:hypothetical protein